MRWSSTSTPSPPPQVEAAPQVEAPPQVEALPQVEAPPQVEALARWFQQVVEVERSTDSAEVGREGGRIWSYRVPCHPFIPIH